MDEIQARELNIAKLSKDMRAASKFMSKREARYVVDSYYDLQDYRIAVGNQLRQLEEAGNPSEFMQWHFQNLKTLEGQMQYTLDKWSNNQDMGKWARAIVGIGPVISSGLIANIDITKAPTVGHIWSFAGLVPGVKWNKGEKRPWNASLKRLCWIMGESFVKFKNHERDVYGKLYTERKLHEIRRNENFELRDQAQKRLDDDAKRAPAKRMDKGLRAIFESGKLPDISIHERAKRWAVKQFLSDWHAAAYHIILHAEPPNPYPIQFMGHVHVRRQFEDINKLKPEDFK